MNAAEVKCGILLFIKFFGDKVYSTVRRVRNLHAARSLTDGV